MAEISEPAAPLFADAVDAVAAAAAEYHRAGWMINLTDLAG